MTTTPDDSRYRITAWRRRSAVVLRRLPGVLAAIAMCAVASAAELVVVEQEGCVYCARFDAEIADAWPNTDQGRRAPLRRVDLHAEWPADLSAVKRPALTPTFVLLDDAGREVDRLAGYPGDEHFWFLMDGMLSALPPAAGD